MVIAGGLAIFSLVLWKGIGDQLAKTQELSKTKKREQQQFSAAKQTPPLLIAEPPTQKTGEEQACFQWLVEHDVNFVDLAPFVQRHSYAGFAQRYNSSKKQYPVYQWSYDGVEIGLASIDLVDLHDSGIQDEDLRHVGVLPNLLWFGINRDKTKITGEGLRYLKNCSKLQAVNIRGTQLVPSEWLKTLTSFQTVNDWQFVAPINNESIEILCHSGTEIKALACYDIAALTEKSYEAIGRLDKLERLTLAFSEPISDDKIKHLAGCKSLDFLCVFMPNGELLASDQTLRSLVSLPKLRRIVLPFTPNMSKETLQASSHIQEWDMVHLDCPLIRTLSKKQGDPEQLIIKEILYEGLSEDEKSKVSSRNSPIEERKRLEAEDRGWMVMP